jgi:para-nitrobenzyl esterase
MLGCTTDEYNYWIAEWEGYEYFEEALTDHMDETYDSMPAEGDALVDEFIKMQMDQGLDQTLANSRYVTEGWRYSHIKYAEEFTAGGGEAYMYLWNVPSNSDTYLKSACHAVDLAYVLNNLEETIFCGDDPDPVTAERTQEAWVNFAKTGNPSIEAVEWPQYDATDRNTMKIEVEEWTVESDPLSESRQLFEQLRPYQEVLTDWGSTL